MHLNDRLGSLVHKISNIDSRIFRTTIFESISVTNNSSTDATQISKQNQTRNSSILLTRRNKQIKKNYRDKEEAYLIAVQQEWLWVPLDEAPPSRCSPEKLSQSAFHRLNLAESKGNAAKRRWCSVRSGLSLVWDNPSR